MEGGGYRQLLAGQLSSAAGRNGPGDLVASSGKNSLGRCVAIGNHQVEIFLFQQLLNVCQGSGDRQHTAFVAASICHQAAAQTRKGMK